MATVYSLVIDQGANFLTTISLGEFEANLETYTIESKLRKHYLSANSVAFTCNAVNSSAFSLAMTANTTANLVSGRYIYDVIILSDDDVTTRVFEGIVTVNPSSTY